MYSALPSNILDFAHGSRVDDAHRVVEHCLRHGIDPRTSSLFHEEADIVKLKDGSLAMILSTKVSASMKSQCYKATTAASAKDILAVACECKCGATKENQKATKSAAQSGDSLSLSNGVQDHDALCVHNPVVLYKFTQLLHEGLAESILYALASCITTLALMSADTLVSVKSSVERLMEATGEPTCGTKRDQETVDEMLARFLTGTEKSKP